MEKELDKLWYSYLHEKPLARTKDEKRLIEEFLSVEKDFLSTLNAEQKIKFNTYEDTLSRLNNLSEKNAFTKGIVFTTRFFIETLND